MLPLVAMPNAIRGKQQDLADEFGVSYICSYEQGQIASLDVP